MKVKQSLEIPYEGNEYACAARQKIDDDISELNRRIQFLRMKRNELAPISILPLEVLSRIFLFVRDLSVYGIFIEYQCPSELASWIHIGHICRHWREIALNCPNLWSVPVLARPNLAQEMIRRSKTVPLTIKLTQGIWSSKALEQLENALAQATRIKSIELALGHHSERRDGILSLLSQPTPLLENVSFWCDSTYDNHIPFPPNILLNAPRLRSIHFDGVRTSRGFALVKHGSLTDLRLTNSLNKASTMVEMMDALHHLPNLRILILEHSIPPHTASDGNIRVVEFKSLERLELNAMAADCASLLRHIQYPSSTTVKLHSPSTSVEGGMTTVSLLGQILCRVQNTGVGIHHSPVVIRVKSDINQIVRLDVQ